jgi:hypothetical protein
MLHRGMGYCPQRGRPPAAPRRAVRPSHILHKAQDTSRPACVSGRCARRLRKRQTLKGLTPLGGNLTVSANNRRYLAFLRHIYEVSNACSTTTYIWGGFTIDVLEGRFLREHHDLDGSTLNLLDVRHDLAALCEERGYLQYAMPTVARPLQPLR